MMTINSTLLRECMSTRSPLPMPCCDKARASAAARSSSSRQLTVASPQASPGRPGWRRAA